MRRQTDLDPFLGGRIETDLQAINPSKGTQAGIVFDFRDEDNYRYALFDSARRASRSARSPGATTTMTTATDDASAQRASRSWGGTARAGII